MRMRCDTLGRANADVNIRGMDYGINTPNPEPKKKNQDAVKSYIGHQEQKADKKRYSQL